MERMRNWLLRNRAFLVFGPAVGAGVAWLIVAGGGNHEAASWGTLAKLLGLALIGVLIWTLMEWVLHRLMHVDTGVALVERIQDSAHLRHHREPADLEHSVARLRFTIPAAGLLLLLARLACGGWPEAVAVMIGLLGGYMWYEFVHLCSHAKSRVPGLAQVIRHHQKHHFVSSRRAYGVTSPLWDWVFGTMPRATVPQASLPQGTAPRERPVATPAQTG